MFDTNFTRPEVTTLTKNDVVGALLVVKTKKYNAEFMSQFGVTAQWTGDVLVVDGSLAGKTFSDTVFFGLLGEQLSAIPIDKTGVVRITQGLLRNGNKWTGADTNVTPEDLEAARKAIESVVPF